MPSMRITNLMKNLLLVLLLALSASGAVSAKVASGPQNLGANLHRGESVFNWLMHQGKTAFSVGCPSGCLDVTKGAGKVSPSTLHERGTKIPGGRKIDDTLAGSNKIKNSQGETFKRVDFAPSKPHAGLSPHTHPNFRNTLPDGSVRSGVSGHGQPVTRKDIIDAARDGGQRTGGL